MAPAGGCQTVRAVQQAVERDPRAEFGAIDIYLFDQILRGRIRTGDRILDAGCGGGRNLHYFLRAGYDVCGLDADREAVAGVRALAARLAPRLPAANFRHEALEAGSFPDESATVVISSAVLHFATDDATFARMLEATWRLLAPGGLCFCRLASTIGIESMLDAPRAGTRRFRLPDGTERYLVDRSMLLDWTDRLHATLLDPIKTTVVDGQRAMTTWVIRRT